MNEWIASCLSDCALEFTQKSIVDIFDLIKQCTCDFNEAWNDLSTNERIDEASRKDDDDDDDGVVL